MKKIWSHLIFLRKRKYSETSYPSCLIICPKKTCQYYLIKGFALQAVTAGNTLVDCEIR
ncbi:unnamed protein product, partial [Nesidiocoris tenuis]